MKSNQFNGERLKAARVYNGLTVAELAERIGLQRQTVSMYENNKISNPDYSVLQSIEHALGFPIKFFLQNDNTTIYKGSTYFRSLLTTSKKYRSRQIQRIAFIAQLYTFISNYINFPATNLPTYNGENPEEAAKLLRSYWSLGDKPIDNLIYLVEQKGIIVTCFDSESDSIDAFSQQIDIDDEDKYLIGYSKNKTTAARIHFDIAHELGHILLHEWSEDVEALSKEEFKTVEQQAHLFAGAFLLPKEAFLKDLGAYGTSLEYYIELKKKWKTSISAMIRRAYTLGAITQFSYQQLMRTMQKKGIKKFEPLDDVLTTASPTLLQAAVQMLLDQNVFTAKEFVDTLAHDYNLSLQPQEIERLLDLKKDTLHYIDTVPEHRFHLRLVRSNKQ
ncbi:helix-turn-helix domain-containing protein [Pelotomaculum propionicicum]|uniref:HTH cro/C1-type domain-containing protein n=1 Tax=Pelotomaculum propionicicum TaxID=258475 RepID=A0A4Y7RMT4_9FIRM|nr:XRE family transcriptional regulator [Pelotomaculum propionicicum]TEB09607.1 hypothetical protein Pmgp_02976 [Pelotomaculum propionicicum]